MVVDLDEDIQVAGWSAAHACFAFASKPDAGASFNASRDIDGKRFFFLDAALTVALGARVFNRLTRAVTGRAGAFNGEKTLLRADFTHACASRAGDGLRAVFSASSVTWSTGHSGRDVDGFLEARERVFKIDAQVVAQVVAALGAVALLAAATAEIAEQVVKNVRERRAKVALTAATLLTAAAHTALECCMTIAVISCLFVRVFQHLVGFVGFFELVFGFGITGVAIGVQLFRLLTIGFFDRVSVSTFLDAERFIKIAFCHGHFSPFGNGKRPAQFKGPAVSVRLLP